MSRCASVQGRRPGPKVAAGAGGRAPRLARARQRVDHAEGARPGRPRNRPDRPLPLQAGPGPDLPRHRHLRPAAAADDRGHGARARRLAGRHGELDRGLGPALGPLPRRLRRVSSARRPRTSPSSPLRPVGAGVVAVSLRKGQEVVVPVDEFTSTLYPCWWRPGAARDPRGAVRGTRRVDSAGDASRRVLASSRCRPARPRTSRAICERAAGGRRRGLRRRHTGRALRPDRRPAAAASTISCARATSTCSRRAARRTSMSARIAGTASRRTTRTGAPPTSRSIATSEGRCRCPRRRRASTSVARGCRGSGRASRCGCLRRGSSQGCSRASAPWRTVSRPARTAPRPGRRWCACRSTAPRRRASRSARRGHQGVRPRHVDPLLAARLQHGSRHRPRDRGDHALHLRAAGGPGRRADHEKASLPAFAQRAGSVRSTTPHSITPRDP